MYTNRVFGTAKCVLFIEVSLFQGVLNKGFHSIHKVPGPEERSVYSTSWAGYRVVKGNIGVNKRRRGGQVRWWFVGEAFKGGQMAYRGEFPPLKMKP